MSMLEFAPSESQIAVLEPATECKPPERPLTSALSTELFLEEMLPQSRQHHSGRLSVLVKRKRFHFSKAMALRAMATANTPSLATFSPSASLMEAILMLKDQRHED
jgi:hypothetical protein